MLLLAILHHARCPHRAAVGDNRVDVGVARALNDRRASGFAALGRPANHVEGCALFRKVVGQREAETCVRTRHNVYLVSQVDAVVERRLGILLRVPCPSSRGAVTFSEEDELRRGRELAEDSHPLLASLALWMDCAQRAISKPKGPARPTSCAESTRAKEARTADEQASGYGSLYSINHTKVCWAQSVCVRRADCSAHACIFHQRKRLAPRHPASSSRRSVRRGSTCRRMRSPLTLSSSRRRGPQARSCNRCCAVA